MTGGDNATRRMTSLTELLLAVLVRRAHQYLVDHERALRVREERLLVLDDEPADVTTRRRTRRRTL